jgi:uncharacterized protein
VLRFQARKTTTHAKRLIVDRSEPEYVEDPHDAASAFDVVHDSEPAETLLAGFSEFGLAGLTAVDYLIDQLDLKETGHITAENLPSIAPFSGGLARHHTRLFSRPDLDITVLMGELFVPLGAADSFGSAIVEWTERNSVEEIAILSGVPLEHGPEAHRSFYIVSDDYREKHLADLDGDGDEVPQPMENGYLSGINGSLVTHGLEPSLAVCVYTTPVHARSPDIDAALRLLETIEDVYDLDIDTGPIEEFAASVSAHYERLAEHVQDTREDDRYDDRMYM